MSFSAAYYDSKRSGSSRTPQLLRDKTPQEWKRVMDEYYKQQRMSNRNKR